MTGTGGVPPMRQGAVSPAQKSAAAGSAQTPETAQAKSPGLEGAAQTGEADAFAAMVTQIGVGERRAGAAPPETGAGSLPEAAAPKRPRGRPTEPPEPLDAEDVLPLELLLTLQGQPTRRPDPTLPKAGGPPAVESGVTLAAALPSPAAPRTALSALAEAQQEAPPSGTGAEQRDRATTAMKLPDIASRAALHPAPSPISPALSLRQAVAAALGPQTAPQKPAMTSSPPPQGERGETAIPRAPTQPGAPEGSAALPPPLPAQAVRDVQLTAARQETVLPGFTVGAPFQQAAEQIAAALSEPEAAARPAELPARPGSAPEPVRVLRIQLQPATLGSLTVQLSLRQNALALRVEASEPRTARLLEADREKLADVLRSAGYEVGALIVQPAAPDRAANPAGQTAAMPDPRGGEGGAQAQPGGSQAGARSDGGGQQGGPARHAPSAGPSEEGSHAPGSRPAGRDLYL